MNTSKRKNRGYKCTDADYKKAMKICIGMKLPLANLIEHLVIALANYDGEFLRYQDMIEFSFPFQISIEGEDYPKLHFKKSERRKRFENLKSAFKSQNKK